MKCSPVSKLNLFALVGITLALTGATFNIASAAATKAVSSRYQAETVFTNGRIYTVNSAVPWVDAIAIAQGKYIYAGSAEGLQQFIGNKTVQVDLGGKMLMPGVNDGHSHPWQGGVKALYKCNFPFSATPEEVAVQLRQCIAASPDQAWLTGGQWTSDFFNRFDIPSPRKWLDAISTDRAIYLNDDATHNAWVNSKTLALAGINRDTPDPSGGTYVRDDNGDLNGLVYEQAREKIKALIPGWSDAQYRAAIIEAVHRANRFGLTGVTEARADATVLGVYQKLDLEEGLTVHVVADQQTPRDYRDYPLDIEPFVAARERFKSPRLHTSFVKIFLDGVPTASRTAYMLQDYLPVEGAAPINGFLKVAPEALAQDIIALDKQGFTVKIHAAGDGSVRVALDAIEAARKANGNSGLQHQLAHAGFIDPKDIPRFAQLNATADLSPYIWYPSPIIDSIVGALGERGRQYFPVKALLDSGAPVLMGSDWPSAANDLSPWHAIEALVTRKNPFNNGEQTLWPEQAITLRQALKIATLDGAKSLRLEQLTGSIEVGKSADFIVLNHNLFDIPRSSISDTEVEQTWFEGALVYSKR
jgi:predicted amidohydrolase YtcJ